MAWFLNDDQLAALQAIREQDWTRPFTVLRSAAAIVEDFYDETTVDLDAVICSGNWAWQSELEARGSEGRPRTDSDVMVACSIEHKALMMESGTRLIIEDIECAIMRVSSFEETAELVIAAKRVML